MSILLKNGIIVNDNERFVGDIFIESGKIVEIGRNIDPKNISSDFKILNCEGKYVIPGGIDPHTHIQMQGAVFRVADDWFSGTRAAAAGGTTCVIDFVPVNKGENPSTCLLNWEEVAKKSVIDYSFHMSCVDWNKDSRDAIELAISHGINSTKVYLAYKDALMLDSYKDFLEFFDFCAKHGILPQVHCEDGDIIPFLQDKLFNSGETSPSAHPKSRPSYVEASAVQHCLSMAEAANCPVYIVHNTCEEVINIIETCQQRINTNNEQNHEERNNKFNVFAECTISHLIFTDEMNNDLDFDIAAGAILSPPLRKEKDMLALWKALKRGVIKTICTDHCPWTLEQKRLGMNDFRKIVNGVPSIEERMTLAWSMGVEKGLITPEEYVAATSTNAAKIFGFYPKKGTIKIGSDADIVIIDPNAKRVITKSDQFCAADFNLFEGIEVKGIPVTTISNGKIIWNCEVIDGIAQYKNGFITDESQGHFIKRNTFEPYVYSSNKTNKK
ncbi:D-hydantoinase family protein [Tritrichomonas foetus]|uniref:dihydropyrimidinase n=1 Tax=Tritrichomonas foetus TaxID=1144522 RepID=A0A1J4J4Y8_9EUKA|nr:D-hydantoinase family protein [Tritrichomonas foetus]|eukprot:OHS92723.1 D-hydantoinase family protein [Tritrichomonas foetus]